MARNVRSVIEGLERKAANAAVTLEERDALQTKAAELRERHHVPVQAAAPPMPPRPPRPPAPPMGGFANNGFTSSGWVWGWSASATFTTTSTNNVFYSNVRVG